MTITAKIIADSISDEGIRLTTLQLRYPRFIHAEGRTHRILSWDEDEIEFKTPGFMEDDNLSRNASSSRAIPVNKLIDDVINDTAMPIHWGKNQPGMQAKEECEELIQINYNDGFEFVNRETAWLRARDKAIEFAKAFSESGYHKQIVNRLLEPFSHINVIVTATEWDNFFELRDHPDAQPEIRVLAQVIKEARNNNIPKLLKYGEWHLPYVTNVDVEKLRGRSIIKPNDNGISYLIKISVARCARVSYLTHDGKEPDIEKDLELYDRLVGSVPLHASPSEHQATPDAKMYISLHNELWMNKELHGNFVGWQQYRKKLEKGLKV